MINTCFFPSTPIYIINSLQSNQLQPYQKYNVYRAKEWLWPLLHEPAVSMSSEVNREHVWLGGAVW